MRSNKLLSGKTTTKQQEQIRDLVINSYSEDKLVNEPKPEPEPVKEPETEPVTKSINIEYAEKIEARHLRVKTAKERFERNIPK